MPDALLPAQLKSVGDSSAQPLALPPLRPIAGWCCVCVLPLCAPSRCSTGWTAGDRPRRGRAAGCAVAGTAAVLDRQAAAQATRSDASSSPARWARSELVGRVRRGAQPASPSRPARRGQKRRSRRKASGDDFAPATSSPAGGVDPALGIRSTRRAATTAASRMLERLRWRLLYEWGGEDLMRQQAQAHDRCPRRAQTAPIAAEPARRRPAAGGSAAAAAASTSTFIAHRQKTFLAKPGARGGVGLASEAVQRFAAPAWQLRSLAAARRDLRRAGGGRSAIDRRPAAERGEPRARPARRRPARRLRRRAGHARPAPRHRAAAHRLHLAEGEPASARPMARWSWRARAPPSPSASAAGRRRLAPTASCNAVQTGGTGGWPGTGSAQRASWHRRRRPRRHMACSARRHRAGQFCRRIFSSKGQARSDQDHRDHDQRPPASRVGEVSRPPKARVVDRPAPRFTFPPEPMIALRGGTAACATATTGAARPTAT